MGSETHDFWRTETRYREQKPENRDPVPVSQMRPETQNTKLGTLVL